MLVGSLHYREPQSGAARPRAIFGTGSSIWRRSRTPVRLLSSGLIVIVVLGLAVRPYAAACASLSCDRMANCDQCDAVPRGCPQALACVKVIPQGDTAGIADLSSDKVEWEIGSPHLAGIDVPPERPPPIDD